MNYNKKPYEEDYDYYEKTEEDLSLGSLLLFGVVGMISIGIMFFLVLA
jgi:hypothetical protein